MTPNTWLKAGLLACAVALGACKATADAPPTLAPDTVIEPDAGPPAGLGLAGLGQSCDSRPCAGQAQCDQSDQICRSPLRALCSEEDMCSLDQGLTCRPDGTDTSRCLPPSNLGGACDPNDDNDCVESLWCLVDGRTCAPPNAHLGERCSETPSDQHRPCADGLACVEHGEDDWRCRHEGRRTLRERCMANSDCAQGLFCCTDCQPFSECRIADRQGPCTQDSDCFHGRICTSDGLCNTPIDEFGACGRNSDCSVDLTCLDGLCQQHNGTCDDNEDCAQSEICFEGACLPRLDRGLHETCNDPQDCAFPFECSVLEGLCLGVSGAASCEGPQDCLSGLCDDGVCRIDDGQGPCDDHDQCASQICLSDGTCQSGQEGADCLIDEDCLLDMRCGPDALCQLGDFGDPCGDGSDCGEDFFCAQGACRGLEFAQGCSSDEFCADGLACVNSVCEPPRSEGAPCLRDDTPDDALCASPLLCHGVTGRCVDVATVEPATACTRDQECPDPLMCETSLDRCVLPGAPIHAVHVDALDPAVANGDSFGAASCFNTAVYDADIPQGYRKASFTVAPQLESYKEDSPSFRAYWPNRDTICFKVAGKAGGWNPSANSVGRLSVVTIIFNETKLNIDFWTPCGGDCCGVPEAPDDPWATGSCSEFQETWVGMPHFKNAISFIELMRYEPADDDDFFFNTPTSMVNVVPDLPAGFEAGFAFASRRVSCRDNSLLGTRNVILSWLDGLDYELFDQRFHVPDGSSKLLTHAVDSPDPVVPIAWIEAYNLNTESFPPDQYASCAILADTPNLCTIDAPEDGEPSPYSEWFFGQVDEGAERLCGLLPSQWTFGACGVVGDLAVAAARWLVDQIFGGRNGCFGDNADDDMYWSAQLTTDRQEIGGEVRQLIRFETATRNDTGESNGGLTWHFATLRFVSN